MSSLDQIVVNKKTIIYVGGLDERVTEQILENVFIPFGNLVNINIPRDAKTGQIRSHAFVEYEDPEDAQAAIDNMNDSELYGRVLTCNVADPKSKRTTGVWGQNEEAEEEAQRNQE